MMLYRPISPWTEARLQSTWSSTDSSVLPQRVRRVAPSRSVVEVRSVDRAEMTTQASKMAPGSLESIMPRRPPSPPVELVHSARLPGDSSPANSRRERYGIATIMPRGVKPVVASTSTSLVAETAPPRAAADNSFDSVPTDYDVSDTTSRSRSGEPVTTTSMDSSSSATGAATAGSGGGGSMDTDSTDKSGGTGSHKLHQMRDDSGYKSLETQQSLGKTSAAAAAASLLVKIGTRSMDRPPSGLTLEPAAAAAVGRVQYSLEAPNVPVKFAFTTPELKDILVPVPQLPVHDVTTERQHDEPTTTKKTSSYSTITEFFAGRSFGSGSQTANDDPTQKRQHIPFVPEAAFLEKFAERTQTVGRALTSSFDRIRQQAGSFLLKTTAVVRGSSDAETPVSRLGSSPYRRASSSDCQSTWTDKDDKLTVTADPYYRRSNSGEVFHSQATQISNPDYRPVRYGETSLHPFGVASTSSRGLLLSESTHEQTTSTSFTAASSCRFIEPETVQTPAMTLQCQRFEAGESGKEIQSGSQCHQLAMMETSRGSTHRQERSVHGPKPVSPSVAQVCSTAHPTRTHAKLPHSVASETAASNPDLRRGNAKTASKRRREYRSKKQVQEVHHSGSLTETTQHQPGPMAPVHGYTTVAGEPSSSENSLEQPSSTSGGGSGASDGSSSCDVVTDLRPTRVLSRDYSVDAKTDALFHEFVKYDPNLSGRQRKPRSFTTKDTLCASSKDQ